jgi:hypothetical protein
LHNDLVLTVWDAKVEDDQVQLEGYSDLAASGIEVDTCGRECLKINQESHNSFILIKVLFICFFILIKMYF